MKIYTSNSLPETQAVLELLRKQFGHRYSCELFGLGKDKTIMVRQSAFVAAQVTIRQNEITVQGMPSQIIPVIGMTELAIVLVPFLGWLIKAPWKKIEREVATFLQQSFN